MAFECKYNNRNFNKLITKYNYRNNSFRKAKDKPSIRLTDLRVCAVVQDVESYYYRNKGNCFGITFADKNDKQFVYQTANSKCIKFLNNAKDNNLHVSCDCWLSKKVGNLQQINGNMKTINFKVEE